ncbi:class I SAM-dependent methyltransferase [Coxiella burnetii]|uniref:class I SAM-dependent methyltransferase n=1 Tax=Coxiella burnetii TaxID=777 RepID=UPI000183CDEF|nr:class I SAM-dependent methyltransferase [Coxiella burnetii]ACJ18501.1 methyltransferase [Coxiella burnetii CbuG_Q212]ATN66883.1 methyltransferase [Coxiella burnetii]OYK86206.1 class I SAM-dependent methyltransferase [Coxiella burnetii]
MFYDLIPIKTLHESEEICINGVNFEYREGILRDQLMYSQAQKQTAEIFGYKWRKTNTYDSQVARKRTCVWLNKRYGEAKSYEWLVGGNPLLLDAGVGAGLSALEWFRDVLNKIRFIGVDISSSVEIARQRFASAGFKAEFLQMSIENIPFPDESIDVIFSEGVLHHTNSTKNSFKKLVKLLKKDGRFLFYIYRKKGPIREFCDDYIRSQIQDLSCEKAWEDIKSLSKLGKILGDLNIEIEIPEEIKSLNIPAGKINLQRFFYWHIFKAFYHPDLNLEELTHINYDWYAPRNEHRHTEDEIIQWCNEEKLEIERIDIEPAGISVIARKA